MLQVDGSILVYGGFLQLKDSSGATYPVQLIARLDKNGVLDPSFDSSTVYERNSDSAEDAIWAVNQQADGKIILSGDFLSTKGGAGLARLSNNIPGWQDLSVGQSPDGSRQTITWLRKGGSPELWRVWFEYSPDP